MNEVITKQHLQAVLKQRFPYSGGLINFIDHLGGALFRKRSCKNPALAGGELSWRVYALAVQIFRLCDVQPVNCTISDNFLTDDRQGFQAEKVRTLLIETYAALVDDDKLKPPLKQFFEETLGFGIMPTGRIIRRDLPGETAR